MTLAENSYGKSGIRLLKVSRNGEHHVIRDLTVAVALEGDFVRAHTEGDNSAVLPTDTMKNTVYAKAHELQLADIEPFGLALTQHFLAASPNTSRARVTIEEHGWRRLEVNGAEHDHAFERGSNERRIARVSTDRDGNEEIVAGVEDLVILKSAHSAFSGYPRDKYTTLKETEDRILATSMTAHWTYEGAVADYSAGFAMVRSALLATFAGHDSKSVQHTLYTMGEAALAQVQTVREITITMPNKHHLLMDMSAMGLENRNEIFVPTLEPYGLIVATLRR